MKFNPVFAAVTALLIAVLSACSTIPQAPPARPTVPDCRECGTVVNIQTIPAPRAPARPASATGGVLAGVLAKPSTTSTAKAAAPSYRLFVQMDDGRRVVLEQSSISPRLRIGSTVRISDGRAVLMR